MTDEEEQRQLLAVYLWGRSIAQEMLQRVLWVHLAERRPDPERFIEETIEGMIASMDERRHADDPAVLYETAVDELRLFADQVLIRLRGRRKRAEAGDADL